jgi:chitinase
MIVLKNLDDYHGSWDGKTGHNSPLYAMRYERKKFREWNINSSMQVWVELGCPKEKLNIGLSAYGLFDLLRVLYNKLFL